MKLGKTRYRAFRCWLKVGPVLMGFGLITGVVMAEDRGYVSGATHPAPSIKTNALRDEVQRALTGYNYVLKSKQNGAVESVIVSGENGSGRNNRLTESSRTSPDRVVAQTELPAQPNIQLPKKLQGKAAIEALGAQLPAVAAAHGMSEERFKEILLNDGTSWIDTTGRLFYVESPSSELEQNLAAGASGVTQASPGTVVLDLSKTFFLHSRPGANRVIYLDFTGDSISGTAWNNNFGKTFIDAQPFDLNGNPSVFDDNELTQIQNIWRRVAEDYAPFDVDVTTEEPPAEALDRSSTADQTYGTRVLITKNVSNCACGGIAYVGVFDYPGSMYKPAWVFYDKLGPGNEKYVAETASHEAGHNLGLHHDGTGNLTYYGGHGAGPTGWAPIMGSSFYKELTQWSLGEYPYANNQENDVSIMASHGAVARPDDAGNTPLTALPLAGTDVGGNFTVDQSGMIETRTDVDYFVFAIDERDVNLAISPAALGPNLDIGASLYSADGTLIAASNPPEALDAAISTHLATGTYYLAIDGVGKPQTALDPGYSDYGSLGQYKITGTLVKSQVQQPPVAVASGSPLTGTAPLTVTFSSNESYDDGVIVAYNWDFGDGTADSDQANPQHTFVNAGTYPVTLTVTDSAGLTGSATVTVTVESIAPAASMHIDNLAMYFYTNLRGTRAQAYVVVMNGEGQPVPNATVSGKWSWNGQDMGNGSATTNTAGLAVMYSPLGQSYGTYTLTVTGISRSGYTYEPSRNVQSSISATR